MNYNYAKAKQLDDKAHSLIRHHRNHMFYDFETEWTQSCHTRAIKRIKKLMMPYWDANKNDSFSDMMLRAYD